VTIRPSARIAGWYSMMTAPDSRLAALPDAAIGLALGMSVAQPDARHAGRVSVLIDELRHRGVFDAVMAALDPELAQSIRLLDSVDRGQRWAQTGSR